MHPWLLLQDLAQRPLNVTSPHRTGLTMHNALTTIATRAALVLALVSPLSANAGLVTGSWDPVFGSPFSDLSWALKARFNVADACIGLGDGDHQFSSPPTCGVNEVVEASLWLFPTSSTAPTDFNNFGIGKGHVEDFIYYEGIFPRVTGIRVLNGQVVGVQADVLSDNGAGVLYTSVSEALGNRFALGFDLDGPNVICMACSSTGYTPDNDDIISQRTNLEQVLTSFNDNGSAKLKDANGRAIGVRLDQRGAFVGLTGTPVPEPGSLPLVLGALASAAWLRRRQAR